MRPLVLLFLAVAAWAGAARAHDLPGAVPVTGFFDSTAERAELVLRVPLIMLTNLNLPKRGPGYLDLARIGLDLERAEKAVADAFRIEVDGERLLPVATASRISQPSERTFEAMDTAIAAIEGSPLAVSENVFWNQGFFDVRMTLEASEGGAAFALVPVLPPGMAERTLVTLDVIAPGRPVRTLSVAGDVGRIALDPAWHQAGGFFLVKGVEHILIGIDHLLFLLCLILPLRSDPQRLLGVVTAFTVGHSATLIPAALGLAPNAAWFLPLVETLIAVSIVWMAVENVLGAALGFRWKLAFGFGLIHGFGFASTLTDVMQFAGSHLLTSLVFFNVGIEVGQLLVLAVVVPVLALLFRNKALERSGIIVISLLAGHEAWHWATERAAGIPLELGSGARIYPLLTWLGVILSLFLTGLWAASLRRKRAARPPRAL